MTMIDIFKLPSGLSGLPAQFGNQARSIFDRFVTPLNEVGPPASLYHYTDEAGLKGILESGTLWFTDLFCLNDKSELKFGLSHLADILKRKCAGQPPQVREFVSEFKTIFSFDHVAALTDYFSCSFSNAGDDLNQWKAYCNNCKGYSIEFDGNIFQNIFAQEAAGKPGVNYVNFPVNYGDRSIVQWLQELSDQVAAALRPLKGYYPGTVRRKFFLELGSYLVTWGMFISLGHKDEAFKNEGEYRLLQLHLTNRPRSGIHTRMRYGKVARYRKFDWRISGRPILKSIVIGPGLDPDRSEDFVQGCLREYKSNKVSIRSSNIPLRI